MKPQDFFEEIGVNNPGTVHWNLTREALYEDAIKNGEAFVAKGGPVVVYTGKYTGRSPKDKFIVREPSCEKNVWWGEHNQPISEDSFDKLFARVQKHLEGKDFYVHQLYTGADPKYRIKVRLITELAWHGLFARNLFIDNVTDEEHKDFDSDFTVIGVPSCLSVPEEDGTRSECFIVLNLAKKIALIGGTPYAGEIKKSIFTVMNYFKPLQGVMSMHCSANKGADGKTAVFFGLSGTGKTTLSSDPNRKLIGDDEHGWSDEGVFNYEGGCYAKIIRLSAEGEPEIYRMTHTFGNVLENIEIDMDSRVPNLDGDKFTENTRTAYPIDALTNVVPSGCGGHPSNIILLTADAFGVLPPVAKLTPELIQKYFLVGYTAKVAGTEKGITEPVATFSACFGAPFMALQPTFYAELLAKKMSEHKSDSWLINTGWIGGGYGVGERISLKYTRAIVTAVLDGSLSNVETVTDPVFGLAIPTSCPNVPAKILNPIDAWDDKEAYKKVANDLASKFDEALSKFEPKGAAVTA